MARELIQTEQAKVTKGFVFDDETIMKLGREFNCPELLHIEELYFTSDGKYYFKAHTYNGPIKEFRNKKYVRIPNVRQSVPIGGEKKIRLIPTPEARYEIIKTILVEDLIKDYTKLLNKKK